MRAKNVPKHTGKEVSLKVELDSVTSYDGEQLTPSAKEKLKVTPLVIVSTSADSVGDVLIQNWLGDWAYVHHKFIKLANKESK